ncbi:MAG: hypothetical protein JW862_18790 [Anaerolineales bacterium]|nr:hypothetical protein [Anaerolineales bacterium]
MKQTPAWHWFLTGCLVALASLAILLPKQAPVTANTDQVTDYLEHSTVVVPAAAFHSDGWDPDGSTLSFPEGFLIGTLDTRGCVTAPVHLPPGVRLTGFSSWVFDHDDELDLYIRLRRIDLSSGEAAEIAAVHTEEERKSIQELFSEPLSQPVGRHQAYYLTTCMYTDHLRLYSVVVYYEYASLLPSILR